MRWRRWTGAVMARHEKKVLLLGASGAVGFVAANVAILAGAMDQTAYMFVFALALLVYAAVLAVCHLGDASEL